MDKKQRAWDEYFMKIAETVALKSKDPSSKMGCVIVDPKKRVVSLGYNGMLQGADESKMTLNERRAFRSPRPHWLYYLQPRGHL